MKINDLTTPDFWEIRWSPRKSSANHWTRSLRNRARRVHELDKMIEKVIDMTGKAEPDVIELGCAPGTMLERIHSVRCRARLHGIDFAEQGIDITSARLNELKIDATLHCGDIRSIEIEPKFDVVFSFGLIEHFEDPESIIRCHSRFAKNGGLVFASVPNYANPFVCRVLQYFSPETLETHNLKIMSEAAMHDTFLKAGLREVGTGEMMGPLLPTSLVRNDLMGKGYRATAQLWNVASSFIPGSRLLWEGYLWGMGRK